MTSDGEVKIKNSSTVITPWVQYGYSAYLNHCSQYSDYFIGRSSGIQVEWLIHNCGYYAFGAYAAVGDVFGFDVYDAQKKQLSCKEVDLGPTLFDDSVEKHGILSTTMKVVYFVLSPQNATADYLTYTLN